MEDLRQTTAFLQRLESPLPRESEQPAFHR